jgi:hypothetical protein
MYTLQNELIYCAKRQKCVYVITNYVPEMVFHSVPQTVVHTSLAVAIELSSVIADKNNLCNNIFTCGNKGGYKKL